LHGSCQAKQQQQQQQQHPETAPPCLFKHMAAAVQTTHGLTPLKPLCGYCCSSDLLGAPNPRNQNPTATKPLHCCSAGLVCQLAPGLGRQIQQLMAALLMTLLM